MKVLIIGGTGILSKEIRNLSVEKGYEVVTVNRGKRKEFINNDTFNIVSDVINETGEDIRAKLGNQKFDVAIDFVSRNTDQLKKIIGVVETRCSQFIFISSASCYAEKEKGHRYIEEDPIDNQKWDYCIKKAECETYLRNGNWDFKYTIIRPYVTYGETRIPFQIIPIKYYTLIERMVRDKPILITNKNAKCTLTSSREFAIGLVGLFLNNAAYNQIFHIISSCEYTWEQVINIIAEGFGVQAKLIEIDIKDLTAIKNPGIDLQEIIGDKSRDMVFNNQKIKEIVPEFKGEFTFEEEIQRTVEYFKYEKHKVIDYLWDGCVDRIIERYLKNKKNDEYRKYNLKNIGGSFREKVMYFVGRNESIYSLGKKIKRSF